VDEFAHERGREGKGGEGRGREGKGGKSRGTIMCAWLLF